MIKIPADIGLSKPAGYFEKKINHKQTHNIYYEIYISNCVAYL